ncbi:MAG TPA: acyl-CoA reductase [Pantanalinema sp.]
MREHYVFGRTLKGELTEQTVRDILVEAQERKERLSRVPIDRILSVFDRAARLWADPAYAGCQEVMRRIPEQIGFSSEMVAQELGSLKMALSRAYLEPKIRLELGSLDALDMWQGGNGAAFKRAVPRGVVLHVSSGNVFTGGILSMIEGVITKNVNLLKAASKAPLFPLLFARSLKECDPDGAVADSIAILSWSGGKSRLHKVFQQHCDGIVVWGGEEVVREYREGLSLKAHLVEYGPKVSFAAIAKERLLHPEVAMDMARSLALWDQNACSSPQVLYLEDPTEDGAPTRAFVASLQDALSTVQRELPQGPLTMQERAEVTKEREMARFDAAMGTAELYTPGNAPHWTVIVEKDPAFKLSPLFRTLYVKRLNDLSELPAHLAPYGDSLQTAGVSIPPERLFGIADRLLAAGVLRVTPLAEMSGGTPGEPHDGLIALNELVKWVSIGFSEANDRFDGAEWLGPEELDALSFGRRLRLVSELAPRAPYHRDRLEGIRVASPEDWAKVPLMERDDVALHTPPVGEGLFTQAPMGGHFLRSGGSSASPKLSVFSFEDYEDDMARAARGAYAVGLRRGDRVANLFYSGGLYGSFLSVNRALEIVGCNSFPFTSSVPPEQIPYFLRAYGIDTLMGLPSWLLRVFDAIKADPEGIRIRKVFYTGEHLYPSEQEYLKRTFGVEVIGSIGYGTVDAGPIGFQCPHSKGAEHHIHADHQYVELIDRRTREPAGPGGFGEVVVTNLNRRIMPLIRYKIGDLGRWVEGDCPCGRSMPRLELLGRSDDVVIVAGHVFPYADFQQAASTVEGLSSMIQLEAKLEGHQDHLVVRAELVGEDPAIDVSLLQGLLATGVSRKIPLLGEALANGLLADLRFEVLPAGGLPRLERTGKVKRIIDQRLVKPGRADQRQEDRDRDAGAV